MAATETHVRLQFVVQLEWNAGYRGPGEGHNTGSRDEARLPNTISASPSTPPPPPHPNPPLRA